MCVKQFNFYRSAPQSRKRDKLATSSKEQIVAADLLDDLIHRYDAPRDLSDDLEPHGYCPSGPGSSEPWEQQVRFSSSFTTQDDNNDNIDNNNNNNND